MGHHNLKRKHTRFNLSSFRLNQQHERRFKKKIIERSVKGRVIHIVCLVGIWRSVTEYYENSDKTVTGGEGVGVLKMGQISVT